MYGELLNLCLYDPDTDESVALLCLVRVNCGIDGDWLISRLGSIHGIGCGSIKEFVGIGVYPVSISYIQQGKEMRTLEGTLDGLTSVGKNIVYAEGGASALLRKIGYKRKTA